MIRIFKLAVAWIAFFTCTQSQGYYYVSYTGGGGLFCSSKGSCYKFVYGDLQKGFYGTWGYFSRGGSITCSGTITATFQWNGALGQPPSAVVVQEDAHAVASGESRDCDNGFGDPPFVEGDSMVVRGTHYRIIDNPGQEFSITCEPYANASESRKGRGGWGAVSYRAQAFGLQINIGGATWADGRWNALIGQGLRLSLNDGFYVRNYNWEVPGNFSKRVDYPPGYPTSTPDYRRIVRHTPSDYQQPTFDLFYDVDSDGAQYELRCTVDVYVGKKSLGQANLRKNIRIWQPDYDARADIFSPQSRYIPDPQTANLVEPSLPGLGTIRFRGSVTTPPPFGISSGQWSFAQLITVRRTKTFPALGQIWRWNHDDSLDNRWPYPSAHPPNRGWWATNGDEWTAWDTPNLGLIFTTAYSVQDIFKMYMVYRPVDRGAGSYEVPLKRLAWQWEASGERNPPENPYSGPLGSGVTRLLPDLNLPFRQLEWERRFYNNMPPDIMDPIDPEEHTLMKTSSINNWMLACSLSCILPFLASVSSAFPPDGNTSPSPAEQKQMDACNAWIKKAEAAAKISDYQNAIDFYKQALKVDAHEHKAFVGLADVLETIGSYQEAYDWYQKLFAKGNTTSSYQTKVTVLDRYATLCEKMVREEEAEEIFKRILALGRKDSLKQFSSFQPETKDPVVIKTYAKIMAANHLGGMGKDEQAEQYCQQAVVLSPDSALVYYYLGNNLTNQQKYNQALSALERALYLVKEDAVLKKKIVSLIQNTEYWIDYYKRHEKKDK